MQYLRSLVPGWLWSAQDPPPPAPLPLLPPPCLPRALFFHQLNFTLGFLRPNLMAFLPLSTPTESQVAAGLRKPQLSLLSVPRMPLLCDKVYRDINQNWVLGSMDCPFGGSQTTPAWQVAYAWIRKGSTGLLPSSRHSCFSNYRRDRHLWPPVKHCSVSPFS